MKTRRVTFSKDKNSVSNQFRANVCEHVFYFENMKEKRVQKIKTMS